MIKTLNLNFIRAVSDKAKIKLLVKMYLWKIVKTQIASIVLWK